MHPMMQVYRQGFSACDSQMYVLNVTSVSWSTLYQLYTRT